MADLAAWVTEKLNHFKGKVNEDIRSKMEQRQLEKEEARPPEEPAYQAAPHRAAIINAPIAAQTPKNQSDSEGPEWKMPVPSELL
ncbi:hypothetical protein, partial [Klebsiella pneumoniae]|uniref:hypothetical protein n=1 Tax=Klebsiella pneumoniae TaxID=573 RepID=UPI00117A6DF9